MVQPINLIFKFLQTRTRVQVWLFEQTNLRLEGYILGFDEYMNIVLDDAEEVYTKKPGAPSRRRIGQILLKGDNITLMQMARPA
jgi:small nuclear ribonucleoprotein E